MKRITVILCLFLLAACGRTADTARRFCTAAGESCTTVCVSADKTAALPAIYEKLAPQEEMPVISLSLAERSATLLTW